MTVHPMATPQVPPKPKHAARTEGTWKTSAMASEDRNRVGSTRESGPDQKMCERG